MDIRKTLVVLVVEVVLVVVEEVLVEVVLVVGEGFLQRC